MTHSRDTDGTLNRWPTTASDNARTEGTRLATSITMRRDRAHKDLFSHAEMVVDLIRACVPHAWVHHADFTTLERVNGSYVTPDMRDRHDDVVWRMKVCGRWTYVYILLEFQHRIDPTMALRMVAYQALLALDLVKHKRVAPSGPYPQIVPIVLYSGDRPWTAKNTLSELFEPPLPDAERFALQGRYLLIEERLFDESPLPTKNLVRALFALGHGHEPDDVPALLRALAEWLASPDQGSLQRAFVNWIRFVFAPRVLPDIEITDTTRLEEISMQVPHQYRDYYRRVAEELRAEAEAEAKAEAEAEAKAHAEARAAALAAGKAEGLAQALAQALITALGARFGGLSPDVVARVSAMTNDQLLRGIALTVEGASLEAILRDER